MDRRGGNASRRTPERRVIAGAGVLRAGGRLPTVTDAAVALGYIDPDFFLGGAMRLDEIAARRALEAEIARPLGLTVEDAALAIVMVTTENMVQAIVDITLSRGIDTRKATLIGGGGAHSQESSASVPCDAGPRRRCRLGANSDVAA